MKRRWISIGLCLFMVLAAPAYAQSGDQKEEVVYANLSESGSVAEAYVVNIFQNQENILDYGAYKTVRNMTSEDKIRQEGDRVSLKTKEDRLYYQGELEKAELPWNIQIQYELNGAPVSGEDLAGQSGKVEIFINIQENKEADPFFFENYAMQVSVALDTKYCGNIVAEGATEANAGAKKQLTYTILPGKEKKIRIATDAVNFQMEGISVNGIKMSMDMGIDIDAVTAQFEALEKAAAEIDKGAKALSGNMGKINTGAQQLKDGAKELEDGLGQLEDQMGDAKQLSTASGKVKTGISSLASGMKKIETSVSYSAYKAAMAQNGLNLDQLKAGNQNAAAGLRQMVGTLDSASQQAEIQLLEQTIALLEGNSGAISGMEGYLTEANRGIAQVSRGASQLNSDYPKLDSGINQLINQLSGISSDSIKQFTAGADKLANGTAQMKDGSRKFSDGTGTFKKGTDGMSQKLGDTIDEMMGNGDSGTVKSFVSPKNKEVASVQFVIKSQSVQLPEKKVKEEKEEKELGIWGKIRALFEKK